MNVGMLPDQKRGKKTNKISKEFEAARSQNAVARVTKVRGSGFDKYKGSIRYLRCQNIVETRLCRNERKHYSITK